ncbi:MAG: hypothetical protein ACON4C_02195 [Henriciella sp.]
MKYLLPLLAILFPMTSVADETPVDFWVEAPRLFGTASGEGQIDHDLTERRNVDFKPQGVSLDRGDSKVGDFALVYRPSRRGMPERFGFVSSLWGARWSLDQDYSLSLWLKGNRSGLSRPWSIRLVDMDGDVATSTMPGISKSWQQVSLPLSNFTASDSFDWDAVGLVDFEAPLGNDPRIWMDGVRFEKGSDTIGVTDKSIRQRQMEAAQSRSVRTQLAFLELANDNSRRVYAASEANRAHPGKITKAFAMMMANVDLETANEYLIEKLEQSTLLTVWSLNETPFYIRFYDMFSSKSEHFPGRLSEEAEALLLETLWERNLIENDINMARQSTWWMVGSENHDLQAKASSFAASRIFMNEPEYADRLYPNLGYGAGYHYGHSGYFGPGVDPETRHGGGRANHPKGQEQTPAEQYAEWAEFFKAYLRERAKHGFFLENASPTYSKHSLSFLDLAARRSGDPELERLWDDFYTLYWADWAQTTIAGVRGGPKTRHHRNVGGTRGKPTADLVTFHLGGPGNPWTFNYWDMLNDYQLPEVVWHMILDREGMGSFLYQSRGIGEEENVWPRPLGNERGIIGSKQSRLLKSTYVTPDYTLGTQMDHPGAVHSHLSIAGRWHGMTFAQSPEARILPVGRPEGKDTVGRPMAEFDLELMMHTLHDGRTLIMQQSRRWFAMHPEWFPSDPRRYNKRMGVWFGDDWDEKIEQDGWVFVRKRNAFAAVRPVLWDEAYERSRPDAIGVGNQINFNNPFSADTVKLCEACYGWNDAGTIMTLADNFMPIIVEAGNVEDFGSFEAFREDVVDNPIALYKTVVPGFHIMVYTGSGEGREEIVFNAGAPEIPTIGGEYIDYTPDLLFDSPYMTSEFGSGVVSLKFGDQQTVLDFSN